MLSIDRGVIGHFNLLPFDINIKIFPDDFKILVGLFILFLLCLALDDQLRWSFNRFKLYPAVRDDRHLFEVE